MENFVCSRTIILVVLIGVFFGISSHAFAQTATPPPSVTPPPSPSPSPLPSTPTPTPSIEDRLNALEEKFQVSRIDTLEKQAQNLEQSADNFLRGLFELAKVVLQSFWLIVIIFTLLILKSPLTKLISTIAGNLHAVSIEFGDFKWNPQNQEQEQEITELIFEAEKLKTVIAIAAVDNDYSGDELEELREIAKRMSSEKSAKLPERLKKDIIITAVDMALADKVFRDDEYIAIKTRFDLYEIRDFDLHNYIINKCVEQGIQPPPKLRTQPT